MTEAKRRLREPVVTEISLVDDGDNPGSEHLMWKRRAFDKAEMKTVDGVELPAGAFAYVPDSTKPSTWKLPLYTSTSSIPEKPDAARVGAAIAALGPGGFRGRKVEVPTADRSKVIGRVRSAWLRAHPDKSKDDLPSLLKKGRDMGAMDRFYQLYNAAKEAFGGTDPGKAVRKALYDEVRAEGMKETANAVLERRLGDLSQAFYGTLFFDTPAEGETRDVEAELQASLKQFAGSLGKEIPEILAGRIVKAVATRFEGDEIPPDPDEFAAGVGEELRKLAAIDNSPTGDDPEGTKGEDMTATIDLSKLSDADRTTVEKALKASDRVVVLEGENATLTSDLEKAKLAPAETPPVDPSDEELLKALPENVRLLIEKRDKKHVQKNDALALKVTAMEKRGERADFVKTVNFDHVPESADTLADLLVDVPIEKRDKIVGAFKACDELIAKGGDLTHGQGSDRTGSMGDAWAEIQTRGEELRKLHPEMSIEKARATVTEQDPELYRRYVEEGGQGTQLAN